MKKKTIIDNGESWLLKMIPISDEFGVFQSIAHWMKQYDGWKFV